MSSRTADDMGPGETWREANEPAAYCPDCGSKLEEVEILHPVVGYETELLCPNRCGETR